MIHIKATVALIAILLSLSSCSHPNEKDALFLRADVLMEEHPDSALSLLQLPSQDINELSEKECSRYALLLARATDKNKMSLLPCDSLLNVAIEYYDDDEKEKALALLYKGRLAVEMEQVEEATSYLQEALSIIQNFPKELKTKSLILCSLGNIYFDAECYDESILSYQNMYKCCITDLDKSIALNNISFHYCMTNEKDSAIMFQHQALDYAIASGDSLQIAMSKHNLSLRFSEFDEIDSALYYARGCINELPHGEKRGIYYSNLGYLLLNKGENKDSITHYLNKSLEDIPILGRSFSLKLLYQTEKESKNYETANIYLEEYADIIDSLHNINISSDIQQLIYEYNTKMRVREEQIKANHTIYSIIAGFVFVCLLLILIYQNRINRKKRLQLQYKQSLEQTQNKLSSLETTIENNQLMIALLHKEKSDLKQEQEIKEGLIYEREQKIAELEKEKIQALDWLLAQSSIYQKVLTLSKQTTDKKNLKVLNTKEQIQLKNIVFEIYQGHISSLKEKYPKLTESDLLYLCLRETSLEPRSIAICLGYSDTHPINQKKYRIKERMAEEKGKV